MQIYDIIMLVILAAAVIWGLWKGLAWQLASFASLTVSYVVAYQFRDQVAGYINAQAPWNMFLAMLILYAGTALVIWIGFRLVAGTIDKLKLQEFDAQLGGLLGLAKGALACGVVTLFAMTLLPEEQKKAIVDSRSGYYLAVGLDHLQGVMPAEWHDAIHPYVHPFGGEDHGPQQIGESSKSFPLGGQASPIGGGAPIGSGTPGEQGSSPGWPGFTNQPPTNPLR